MKINQIVVTFALGVLALGFSNAPLSAAPLTEQNKQFLAGYNKVHDALVADDLAGAKKAAGDLGDSGKEVADSRSLDDARKAFTKVSNDAEILAVGQSGYYVMHCPMKNADWVQTTSKVENPYGGKEMLSCGEVKK